MEYPDIEKLGDFERIYMNEPYEFRRYTKMETILIQVSGFDVEKLIELFAAGYTLKPPKKESIHDLRIIE